MQVWQSVKAIGDIERAGDEATGGQAGVIVATDFLEDFGEVDVKWDVDGEIEAVALENLLALN